MNNMIRKIGFVKWIKNKKFWLIVWLLSGMIGQEISYCNSGKHQLISSNNENFSYNSQFEETDASFVVEVDMTDCLDFGQSNGYINLLITGDTSNLVINWNTGNQTTSINNLEWGDYTVQIQDTVTNCTYSNTFSIGLYYFIYSSSVFCASSQGNDGAIYLTTNNPSAYTFEWSNGAMGLNNVGLSPGIYNLTVTNGTGCTKVETFDIGYSEMTLTNVEVRCSYESGETGSISVDIEGGIEPLTYRYYYAPNLFIPGTDSIGHLAGRDYTLVVIDAEGCRVQFPPIEVCEEPDPIPECVIFQVGQVSGNVGDTVCVPVSVNNFNDIIGFQFSFNWNQNVLDLVDIQNIGLDYLDESSFSPFNLYDDALAMAWYDDDVQGIFLPDESVIFDLCFVITGNIGEHSYIELSGSPTLIEVIGSFNLYQTFNGIPGLITVGSDTYLPMQIYDVCQTSVNCSTESESNGGSLNLFVNGGQLPYSYQWSGPNNFSSTESELEGLLSGEYAVTITDAIGNTVSSNHSITNDSNNDGNTINSFDAQANICTEDNALKVTVTNPDIDHTYLWNTGDTTQTITGVSNQNYIVTVTNQYGCQSVDSTIFDATIDLNLSTATTCEPNYGKSYALHTTLPVGDLLNVVWNDGFSMATSNSEVTRTDVPPGTYYATVSNSAGCAVTTDTVSLTGIVDIGGDSLVCEGSEVPLSVTTVGELTFEWSPAEGLSCTDCPNPTAMPDVPTTYTVTAQSEDDNCPEIRQILVYVDTACVWPGDVNYNGIANHFDILPIGLGNGEMGPIRPNATIEWQAEAALPYLNETPESHVNYKHADTDGNGLVDANDTLAIVQNWGEVHNLWSPDDQFTGGNNNENTLTNPQFYIEQDTAYEGDAVALKIMLGTEDNPAIDVYGLGFSVQYEANMVQPGSAVVVFDTSWIGNINDDMIAIQRNYVPNGRVDVGLTRLDHQHVSGFGQIATCYIVIEDNIFEPPVDPTIHVEDRNGETTDMFMTILRGQIINNEEKEVPAFYTPSSLVILERETNVFESELSKEITLFPNPVNEQLSLNANQLKMNHLTIFDWSGKKILTEVIDDFEKNINVQHLAKGTYFMEFETVEGKVFKRFLKQ